MYELELCPRKIWRSGYCDGPLFWGPLL